MKNRRGTPARLGRKWLWLTRALLAVGGSSGVYAQSTATENKQRVALYTASDNSLTVEAEINVLTTSEGVKVTVKYVYDGKLPLTESYANWKLKYQTERGQVMIRKLSATLGGPELRGEMGKGKLIQARRFNEDVLICRKVLVVCYDIRVAATSERSEERSRDPMAPDSVSGATVVRAGQSATLTVVGGQPGFGGRWVWYAGTCGGTAVGSGESLYVEPTRTTTYFVRAEPGDLSCTTAMVRVAGPGAAPSFREGDMALNVGLGAVQLGTPVVNGWGTIKRSPLFQASLERGLIDAPGDGTTALGFLVAYRQIGYSEDGSDRLLTDWLVALRGSYHYPVWSGMDTYAGVTLGLRKRTMYNYKTTDPVAGIYAGLRYFFRAHIGAFGEVGVDTSLLKLGLCARF